MDSDYLHPVKRTRTEVEMLAHRYRNWEPMGREDELGSGNYVTAEKIVTASKCIRTGAFLFSGHFPSTMPARNQAEVRELIPNTSCS